jgi:putative ABC transport system permease protein
MAVEQGLTALSLVALVTAGFVVLNTMLLNVTERRKQLAILRALGATQRQVRRLLLREALLLGSAGSVVGVGLGLVLAIGLALALESFIGVSLPHPSPAFWLLGAALVAGPLLTFVATFSAASRAARQPPLRDLLDPSGASEEAGTIRGRLAGLALAAASALAAIGLCRGWWSESAVMGPAVAGILAGSALCLPMIVLPMLRGLQFGLKKLLGIHGRLALFQLQRRPARTALTSGVLFIAIASAVGFGHWLLNTLGDLKKWYGNAIVADYLLRGSAPDSSFLMTSPISEKLEGELSALNGVERVDKVVFLPIIVEGQSVLMLARTFAPDRLLTLDLREGDPFKVRQGLMRGDVVIATKLARQLGKRIGETISVDSKHGPKKLQIAGIVAEYAAGGDAIYLEWDAARELFPFTGVHVFLLTAQPGGGAILRSELDLFAYRHQLMIQSNSELRTTIDRLLERITASLWIIVVLTFAVASLGVVNTLTMNVIEQSRDLSLMRAVGMTSAQTRRLVLSQAGILGKVSLIPGAAAGIGLAALINATTNAAFGQQVEFHIHLALVLGCMAVGFLITILAACIPARNAAKYAMATSEKQ